MRVPEVGATGVRAEALLLPAGHLHQWLSAELAGLHNRFVGDDEFRHTLSVAGKSDPATECFYRVSGDTKLIGDLRQAFSGFTELRDLVFLFCSHKAETSIVCLFCLPMPANRPFL
jgi:hypothetical protein